jgi:hypothetical protein
MGPVLQYDGGGLHSIPWNFTPTTQGGRQEIMILSNGKHSYHLEFDDDTHWALVKIGAEIKMDSETYAEQVLTSHVEQFLGQQPTN